ncbi:MAG: hypothetical protein BWY42_00839 [Candidatus Omnitrophica bacterium ADurb.Bin277]|nr:MAG: hypothetical protein BWY42_00839 [Candidatus Omnitrophica bacterium ADurb.Bin277]
MLIAVAVPDHVQGDRFLFDRFPLAPMRSRIAQKPCAQTDRRRHLTVFHPDLCPKLLKLPAGRFRGKNGFVQLAGVNHGFRMGLDIF